MNTNCDTNKTPVEILTEGPYRGTYFEDISPGVNSKWYRKS